MCLAEVQVILPGRIDIVCENVAKATHDGDLWTFTDFLGREFKQRGHLEELDLTSSTITLRAAKPAVAL